MLDDLKFSKLKNELQTDYILPKRIVYSENATNAGELLKEFPRQAGVGIVRTRCTVNAGGHIVLDFGSEIQGGIVITVANVTNTTEESGQVQVTFGESVAESLSEIGKSNATNDHAIRDSVIPVGWLSNFRVGMTGFRFVKITPVNCNIEFDGVQGAFDYRPIEYLGSFRCSDDKINAIWNTAAYTVHLNMQEYLWDGIKRDRLVWIGDLNAETNTVITAFGRQHVVEKSLDYIRDLTPPTTWMNGTPSYSMWWIKNHFDWYMAFGDIDYLKAQKDYLTALVDAILSKINSDGTHRIDYFFVDWSSNNTPYMQAGLNAMLVISLRAASYLLDVMGDKDRARTCSDIIPLIQRHAYEYAGNKQVSALVALADIRSASEIDETILSVDGARGFSTFLGYYGLLAKAKAGNSAGALALIKEYWGGMLDLGATTFWEDFDIDWLANAGRIDEIPVAGTVDVHGDYGKFCYLGYRHSLCHGWASGPCPFLTSEILGIHIAEPGCKTVEITPHLAGLSFAEGDYPTPYGNLHVRVEDISGKQQVTYSAPSGVRVLVQTENE